MASSLCVLLSLALALAGAAPITPDDADSTTVAADVGPLVAVIEVIDTVPVIVPLIEDAPETTTQVETKELKHKVERRSLRGDNPSNDLLADLEAQQYDRGLTSLAGRRIKFLPTFLG